MSNHNTIKVLNWNSRSLNNKITEFFHFVESHDIDVAVVTETWLRSRNSMYHPSYTAIRMDRLSTNADRGGGVAILIKRELSYSQLDLSITTIEAIGIKINTAVSSLNIVAAYYPGSNKMQHLHQFRRDIRMLTSWDVPFFIVGDFNARHMMWNCASANKAGRILFQEYMSSDFYINYPESSTRHPPGRGRSSTLDLTLSNNLIQMSVPIVHTELSSDHLPVTFNITIDTPMVPPGRSSRCYNQANWSLFSRTINENIDLNSQLINNLDTHDKIDEAINLFENIILRAEDASVPEKTIVPRKTVLPESIKLLIRLRNVRRRQYLRTRDPLLGSIVSQLNNTIRTKCAEHRFKNFGDMLRTLDNGCQKFWKLSKNLRNNVKHSPPLKVDGSLLVTPAQKAEALAATFAAAHNNPLNGDSATTAEVNGTIARISDSDSVIEPNVLVRPKEVKSIISAMKTKKAPGLDRIRNVLLKHLPRKGLILLTKILNACLKLCYFPVKWKHASVIAIPKANKDITSPGNYRPISLLSGPSKILERVVLSRLNRHLETDVIVPHEQFGFRKGHSTAHQLVRIKKEIQQNLSAGRSTGMVLLDVEKAYDSVWQQAVVYKLHQSNCPLYIVKIVHSFLSSRTFAVAVSGSLSTTHRIPFGVPQGSVLSPTLYNIFTADVLKVDGVVYAFFADDTAYLASDKDPEIIVTKLQNAQNSLEDFQRKWRIKINATKTQTIFFTKKRAARNLPSTTVSTNGLSSPWTNEANYLGIIYDSKLTFSKHIDYATKKLDKATRSLFSLINRRSKLSSKNKILIFKCILRPIMVYGSPVWGDCAKSHRKRLQVKQNKLLKMIYNFDPFYPTEELHRVTGVVTIEEFINKTARSFWNSCQISANPLIESLHAQTL